MVVGAVAGAGGGVSAKTAEAVKTLAVKTVDVNTVREMLASRERNKVDEYLDKERVSLPMIVARQKLRGA